MAKIYSVSTVMISNEWRKVLIVYDSSTDQPLSFPNLRTIIATSEETVGQSTIKVYTTEGDIWKTYPPDEQDNFYIYWFVLAKEQEAATVANQLAEENATLNEALNIIEGVDKFGNPTV